MNLATICRLVDQFGRALLGNVPLLDSSGNLELPGTLTLDTAVATPAAGQIGKGDTGWIQIGTGGNIPGTSIPVPGFQNSWGNTGSNHARFRKVASGIVLVEGEIHGGTNGTTAFAFPVSWRVAAGNGFQYQGVDQTNGSATSITIDATGNLTPSGGSGDGVDIHGSFYADA